MHALHGASIELRVETLIDVTGRWVSGTTWANGELTSRRSYSYPSIGEHVIERVERIDVDDDGAVDAVRELEEITDDLGRFTRSTTRNAEGDFSSFHEAVGDVQVIEDAYRADTSELTAVINTRNGMPFYSLLEPVPLVLATDAEWVIRFEDGHQARWYLPVFEERHRVYRVDFEDDGEVDGEYEETLEEGCEARPHFTLLI
jgi:hypothetical protein